MFPKIYQKNQLITIEKNKTLTEAGSLMREHHVGCLLITENGQENSQPIGLLTDRDIVIEAVAKGIDPSEVLVEDIMMREVVTAHEFDSVEQVSQLMLENGVRRLPVVNTEGQLTGIVTFDDLVQWAGEPLKALEGIINNEIKNEEKGNVLSKRLQ